MRTPRVVRVMHLNPKRNIDVNEQDYGLLTELTIPYPRLIWYLFVQQGRWRTNLGLRRRSRSARSASRRGVASPGCGQPHGRVGGVPVLAMIGLFRRAYRSTLCSSP